MDAEGLLNGKRVSEGEIIGKVATWGDYEKGTSYHIHFNIQVFTKIGWVWVNPYMTLVTAYERLIGGRGSEILPGAAGAASSRQASGDLASGAGAGSILGLALGDTAAAGKTGNFRPRARQTAKASSGAQEAAASA